MAELTAGSDIFARDARDGPDPRAVAAARAHTRTVQRLRRYTPVVAGLIALVLVASAIDLTPRLPSLSIGDLNISGTTITMTDPRLSGYGKKDEAYRVSAARAEQDVKHPEVVKLEDIDAALTQTDGREATLSAAHGLLNSSERTLVLERDVVVSSDGMVAHLERADVNMAEGTVVSDRPVLVESLDGTIRAGGLQISDKGGRIVFSGGVTLDVTLKSDGADKQAQDKQTGDKQAKAADTQLKGSTQ